MRWCFLGSHEIPDGERMVLAKGGAHICLPCAQTERGKRQLLDFDVTAGYRQNETAQPRFTRALAYWLRTGGKSNR